MKLRALGQRDLATLVRGAFWIGADLETLLIGTAAGLLAKAVGALRATSLLR